MSRTPAAALLLAGIAHLVILAVAAGFPALMLLAEWKWRRTRDTVFLELVRRWARASIAALALAVISSTFVAVMLWQLWPSFMTWARAVVGMPLSVQGAALALALAFLAAFARGRDRLPAGVHVACGILGTLCAVAAGLVFIDLNAWLNAPAGMHVTGGVLQSLDRPAAILNAAFPQQALHFVGAAYTAVGLAVAGPPALAILRRGRSHRRDATLAVALYLGAIGAIVQPAFGHLSARWLAHHQSEKMAALDAVFFTEPMTSLRVLGVPDPARFETPGSVEFPMILSLLLFDDIFAEVPGLDLVPPTDQPPVKTVYLAFQVMIFLGSFVSIVASWVAWKWLRKQVVEDSRNLLWLLVFSAPMAVACLPAGWVATVAGREPWAIHGVLRSSEAYAAARSVSPAIGIALLLVVAAGASLALIAREMPVAMEDAP